LQRQPVENGGDTEVLADRALNGNEKPAPGLLQPTQKSCGEKNKIRGEEPRKQKAIFWPVDREVSTKTPTKKKKGRG